MTFAPTITKREIRAGAVWLACPVVVMSDEGGEGVLAVVLADGAPFSFPRHPGGPHPWSRQDRWHHATALQLRRSDDWHSVWKFFSLAGDFDCWYVNFERPFVRTSDGIATHDLELELVLLPDGQRRWKDVEHLAPALASGRMDTHQLLRVLDAAAEVTDRLVRDDRWWSPWDGWTPAAATMGR